TGGKQEFSRAASGRAHKQEQLPVGIEYLKIVERRVGDVNVPFAVDADAFRPVQRAGRIALHPERAHEVALDIEALHAEVQLVGDVEPSLRVDEQIGGKVELPVFPAAPPYRAHASAVNPRIPTPLL